MGTVKQPPIIIHVRADVMNNCRICDILPQNLNGGRIPPNAVKDFVLYPECVSEGYAPRKDWLC